jgi:hypothetical protein
MSQSGLSPVSMRLRRRLGKELLPPPSGRSADDATGAGTEAKADEPGALCARSERDLVAILQPRTLLAAR